MRVTAEGPREEVRFASVVLYSADTLLENGGTRSGDFDWEVVCLIAGPADDEPMDPVDHGPQHAGKTGRHLLRILRASEFAEGDLVLGGRASAHVTTDEGTDVLSFSATAPASRTWVPTSIAPASTATTTRSGVGPR